MTAETGAWDTDPITGRDVALTREKDREPADGIIPPDSIDRSLMSLRLCRDLIVSNPGLEDTAAWDVATDLLTTALDLVILVLAHPDDEEVAYAAESTTRLLANEVDDTDPAHRGYAP